MPSNGSYQLPTDLTKDFFHFGTGKVWEEGNLILIIKKNALYLRRVNVFSTKVPIRDTILTSPTGDGTAILRGHPSHAKVSPLVVQREYLHFSVIL